MHACRHRHTHTRTHTHIYSNTHIFTPPPPNAFCLNKTSKKSVFIKLFSTFYFVYTCSCAASGSCATWNVSDFICFHLKHLWFCMLSLETSLILYAFTWNVSGFVCFHLKRLWFCMLLYAFTWNVSGFVCFHLKCLWFCMLSLEMSLILYALSALAPWMPAYLPKPLSQPGSVWKKRCQRSPKTSKVCSSKYTKVFFFLKDLFFLMGQCKKNQQFFGEMTVPSNKQTVIIQENDGRNEITYLLVLTTMGCWYVGALSPVSHKGFNQGWKKTSACRLVIPHKSHQNCKILQHPQNLVSAQI